MVMLALASAAFKRLLTVSYRSFSYSVRLKALMTRIPVAFSRTTRIMASAAIWAFPNKGMLFRLILATARIIKGIRKQRMAESQGSMNMVTTTPPSIRIGARTPMRWIMFRVRCRL